MREYRRIFKRIINSQGLNNSLYGKGERSQSKLRTNNKGGNATQKI